MGVDTEATTAAHGRGGPAPRRWIPLTLAVVLAPTVLCLLCSVGPVALGLVPPVEDAVHRRSPWLTEAVLRRGADPDEPSFTGDTALSIAARDGDAAMVRLLLAYGAKPDYMGWDNEGSPLHYAAESGSAEVARLLLEAGASPNQSEDRGLCRTPLHIGAAQGNVDVTRLLLEHGADRSLRDARGRTALEVARQSAHDGVAELLQEAPSAHPE